MACVTTLYDVLDRFRDQAASEAEKGAKFEQLMAAYLAADPTYAKQFSHVYLWKDWPGRAGRPDTGIDLVAVDRLTGENVAIQCKFYAPDHHVSKKDIDTFLSASGTNDFGQRIIISTGADWGPNAEATLKDQQVPIRRIGMSELANSSVDWSAFTWEAPQTVTISAKKQVRPHQKVAIEKVTAKEIQVIIQCTTARILADKPVLLRPMVGLLLQQLRYRMIAIDFHICALTCSVQNCCLQLHLSADNLDAYRYIWSSIYIRLGDETIRDFAVMCFVHAAHSGLPSLGSTVATATTPRDRFRQVDTTRHRVAASPTAAEIDRLVTWVWTGRTSSAQPEQDWLRLTITPSRRSSTSTTRMRSHSFRSTSPDSHRLHLLLFQITQIVLQALDSIEHLAADLEVRRPHLLVAPLGQHLLSAVQIFGSTLGRYGSLALRHTRSSSLLAVL